MSEAEHKPLPVSGYTTQPQKNVDIVNEGKELEERVLRYLDKVSAHNSQVFAMPDSHRCLAIGRTNIQQGFMWAFRSVFNPQRSALPEDVKEG